MSLAEHRARRQRLWFPANAKADHGITMRNGWTVPYVPPASPPSPTVVPFEPKFIWPGNLCGEFWLPDFADLPDRRRPFVDEIVKAVSAATGVSYHAIIGPLRNKHIVQARQIVMALASLLTNNSLPEIGRRLGGRDHTTILHGKRKMWPHVEAVAAEMPEDALVMEWARAMYRRLNP